MNSVIAEVVGVLEVEQGHHQANGQPADDPLPITMRRYGFQGTPSLVLIDALGRLRRHSFGAEDDLTVGAAIAALLAQTD